MDTKELLASFFEHTPQALAFLEKEHDFQPVHGLARYDKGRVVISPPPANLDAVHFPFFATFRYENADHLIELVYGDVDLSLDCFITYNHTYRFSLSDLERFFSLTRHEGKNGLALSGLFTAPAHIEKAINGTAQTLHSNIRRFLKPPEGFLDHALRYQKEILNQNIYQTYQHEMHQACREAALAFQDGNYKRTIMLYRPYRDHLSPEDFRIFSLALMRLED